MTETFEKLNQFKLQNDGAAKARREYQDKVTAASKALDAAKVRLDELVHVEIATGTEKKTEKAAARKEIEQKEKDLQYVKEEQEAANQFLNGQAEEIKAIDVVQAYNNDFAPSIKAEHLPALKERLKQGEDLIISAIYDFNKLKQEYGEIVAEVKPFADQARVLGQTSVLHYISNPFENISHIGFNSVELAGKLTYVNERGQMPEGSTYRKEVAK